MKSKLLKAGLCALVACGCLTGCSEESAANTVDLNSFRCPAAGQMQESIPLHSLTA